MDSDSFNSILLPAFVEHRAPPPFNLPPIIVPFASSTSNLLDTPPPSPRSAAAKFFSRTRTTSLHSNALPLALSNKPVPPLPLNLSSTPASFEPETSLSLIKSISVPHHSKLGGKWMWACRVVPEIATGDKLSSSAPLMHRQGSLGKMEMAVDNDGGPYTVWRKWEEFVDFSTRCVCFATDSFFFFFWLTSFFMMLDWRLLSQSFRQSLGRHLPLTRRRPSSFRRHSIVTRLDCRKSSLSSSLATPFSSARKS